VTRIALLTEGDHLRSTEDSTWSEREWIRRQRLFDRIYQRYDLIGFKEVADWRASVGVPRDETFGFLVDAVRHGEFGTGDALNIVYMPDTPDDPARWPPAGKFPLRVWLGHIVAMHSSGWERYFYAPRELVTRWFQARKYDLPPWSWLETALDQAPANAVVVHDHKEHPPTRRKAARGGTQVPDIVTALKDLYPGGRPTNRTATLIAVEHRLGRKISLKSLDRARDNVWPPK